MNLREMLENAIERQQAIVNNAQTEQRDLTEEEQRSFNAIQAEINDLKAKIQEQEREAAATPSTSAEEMTRAIEAERARTSEIYSLCRDFDMDPTQYINSGATVDAVRAAVLANLKQNRGPVSTRVSVDPTGENDFRRDMSDGLLLRSIPGAISNPTAGAKQLSGMSLRDISIECLAREGRSAGELLRMSADALYSEMARQFYNPTAAFPAILDETIQKSIVHLYNHVPTTFQEFTTKGSLRDFKQTADHEYVIGGAGDFLLVPENGELKHDTPRTERLPQRKLDTYGRQFSMTRQAFINDDIGFLTEVPGLYATSAKKTIEKQVYSLLFNGKTQTIFDGNPLFGAAHANLAGTDAAPTAASIQAMILQMQKQTDQFGEPIYVTPRILLCGVGYEFDLAVIFRSTQITGSSNNDINPLYNYPLQIVQSPVLNAMANGGKCPWFMFADSSIRGIQVDYLNGQETPTTRRMETAGQLGFVWDMWLDWGISVRDYRGIARNDGAVIA